MKKNLLYSLFTAMLLIGFASCDDEEDKSNNPQVGLPTNIKLKISQVFKFASRDNNAKPDELLFKTVDVFIYTPENTLEKHIQLNGTTDFVEQNVGDGVYVGTTSISTTTGQKNIYLGVNLPTKITEQIKENGVSGIAAINNTNELVSTTDGFVMFSDKVVSPTLVENSNDPANTINIQVKRLVAKVAVQAASGLAYNISGGTISNLVFGMRNSNKKYYPLPKIDNLIVKDPNWLSQDTGVIKLADFYQQTPADYMAINPSTITDNKNLACKYTLENTSENTYPDELSFVSVRGAFVPNLIKEYANGSDASGGFKDTDNSAASAATFWRLPLSGGGNIYAISQSVLIDYATINSLDPAGIVEYINGFCYYNLYLNPSNKYDVVRNDFYKTTITKINGIGNPTPDTDNHKPLEKPTNIDITVDILDWNLIDVEGQLPGGR